MENFQKVKRCLFEATCTASGSGVANVSADSNNYNQQPKSSKQGRKKYFCKYCKKLVSQIPPHLTSVHKDEPEVQAFVLLPKGSRERNALINNIRKEGMFLFNTDQTLNQGELLVSRRPMMQQKREVDYYKPCPQCKGYFSKVSLRRHYKKCSEDKSIQRGEKCTFALSRQIILQTKDSIALPILKNKVWPILRNDAISQVVQNDDLLVKFGNWLVIKYKSEHHHKMIRSRLRLLGRFFLTMKSIDSRLETFVEIFTPTQFDNIINAINICSGLDENSQKYKAPAVARDLGTYIKKLCPIIKSDCIKQNLKERKEDLENFIHLFEDELPALVNKTVQECQLENSRKKSFELPTLNDIKILVEYLNLKRKSAIFQLQKEFSAETWCDLAKLTLISIMVFCRRRAGELERMLLTDLKYQTLNENLDGDLMGQISPNSKKQAAQYARISIRGKLARGVPVLFTKDILHCIELILKYRETAGVSKENPYVFGIPSNDFRSKHLQACELMREYSVACGAKYPHILRGTKLRKHIATFMSQRNLTESQMLDLANFLGHADKIHKEHYRLPVVTRDLSKMSKLLEMASGDVSRAAQTIDKTTYNEDETPIENVEFIEESLTGQCIKNVTLKVIKPAVPVVVLERMQFTCRSKLIKDNDPYQKNKSLPGTSGEAAEKMNQPLLPVVVIEKHEDISRSESNKDILVRKSLRKLTWTTPEKSAARNLFKENLNTGTLPTLPECVSAIQQNSDLKKRTPTQLKAWINNEINKFQRTPTKKGKKTWDTPERRTMRYVFANHLKNKTLPSIQECVEASKKYSQLINRKPTTLKAWVNNEIKRRESF